MEKENHHLFAKFLTFLIVIFTLGIVFFILSNPSVIQGNSNNQNETQPIKPFKKPITQDDYHYDLNLGVGGIVFTITPYVDITDFKLKIEAYDDSGEIIFQETRQQDKLSKNQSYSFSFSVPLGIIFKSQNSGTFIMGYKSVFQ